MTTGFGCRYLDQDEIRELAVCPEPYCAVPRGVPCDHDGDPYPPGRRAELNAAGTSHYARMLAAYGKSPAVALQVARRAAGHPPVRGTMDQLAVGVVKCPRHDSPEGVPCPRGGACPARRGLAAVVAARGRATRHDAGVMFVFSSDHAKARENHWADTGLDECLECSWPRWAYKGYRLTTAHRRLEDQGEQPQEEPQAARLAPSVLGAAVGGRPGLPRGARAARWPPCGHDDGFCTERVLAAAAMRPPGAVLCA